jgi:DNA-binding GntR family transcriptional regulator
MKKNSFTDAYVKRTFRMLDSPAYRVLSQAAHRILARIEVELGRHGGKDNGKLPVTTDDFVEYGIHRHAIGPAIRELEELGFIEVIRGHVGKAGQRRPSLYRLTYLHSFGEDPTNADSGTDTVTVSATVSVVISGTGNWRFPALRNGGFRH